MSNLDFIFKPNSVAIVGASTKEGSVGNDIVKNLSQGFLGKVYPVNPKAEELYGLKCYPSLESIGSVVDLMVIVVPAAAVPGVLEEGGALGVKGAIIISAGFKEIGNIDLENSVKEICNKYDIALIGPNCLGIINPSLKLNASFAAFSPNSGNVAFISQSGALCTAILDCATTMGIGFSKFISVGNKAVLDETAILDYLEKDTDTNVVAMYAEQLAEPQKLMAKIKEMSHDEKPTPVVVLKSGKTSAGAGASASHTGALAGNDAAYAALFRQSGIIRANSSEELFDYIKIFSANEIKSAARLAIITNAGGPGVLAIDATVENGLTVASLSEETKNILAASLPAAANIHNPIDVLGDARADRFKVAIDATLADSNVDAAVVILTPQSTTEVIETAQAIVAARDLYKKPIVAAFMGQELVNPGLEILKDNKIAAYSYPESAIKSLGVLEKFYQDTKTEIEEAHEFSDVDREAVVKIFTEAKASGINSFPEASALAVLEAYKLPVLASQVAHNKEEAETIAKEIGKKMVIKIVSPDILHKSDAGGIMLHVTPEEAGVKFEEMMERVAVNRPEAKLEGVLLVEMITDSGTEMILGSVQDPSLGDTIMLGLGGIYVEIIKDVIFGLNPLTRSDVFKMIGSLKSKKVLEGARGTKVADKEALVESVLRLAQLLRDFPEIKEMDINPLLVLEEGKGAKVLDARIVIE
jgi:acetyl coenzyme A synthetase (ADP forming)-like protein